MANNIYLVPNAFPGAQAIDQEAKDFVAAKFPEFELEFYSDESTWVLSLPRRGPSSPTLVFWIDSYPTELDEDGEPEDEEPCIAFRQGHSYDILYWLQEEVFHQLQQVIGGRYFDDSDGSGEPIDNEFKPCSTYLEYLNWRHRHAIRRNATYPDSEIKEQLMNHLKWFPELKRLISS